MLILPQDKDIFRDDDDISLHEKESLCQFVEAQTNNISIQYSRRSKTLENSETGFVEEIDSDYTGETNINDAYFSRMDKVIHQYMLSEKVMPRCYLNPLVSHCFRFTQTHISVSENDDEIEKEEQQGSIKIEFDFFEYSQRMWNGSPDSPMVWSSLNTLEHIIKDAELINKGLMIPLLKKILIGISGPALYIVIITKMPYLMLLLPILVFPALLWTLFSIPISVISIMNEIKQYSKIKNEFPNNLKKFQMIALEMHYYIRYRVNWYNYEYSTEESPDYLVEMTERLNDYIDKMNALYGNEL